jgi:hypothetical protein
MGVIDLRMGQIETLSLCQKVRPPERFIDHVALHVIAIQDRNVIIGGEPKFILVPPLTLDGGKQVHSIRSD